MEGVGEGGERREERSEEEEDEEEGEYWVQTPALSRRGWEGKRQRMGRTKGAS